MFNNDEGPNGIFENSEPILGFGLDNLITMFGAAGFVAIIVFSFYPRNKG